MGTRKLATLEAWQRFARKTTMNYKCICRDEIQNKKQAKLMITGWRLRRTIEDMFKTVQPRNLKVS